jgi:hypothetical protein
MIRWPALIIGIALVVLSMIATAKFPMLPLEPAVLDVQEAIALAGESDYQHVQIRDLPDLDRKIYPTLSVRPVYTGRSPAQKYDLRGNGESLPADLDSYLGTVVRIMKPLEPTYVAMRTLEKRTGEDKLLRERLLAPVSDCEGKVWAISAAFKADDPQRHGWPYTQVVEGVLTRVSEVNTNMRTYRLEHDWKDVKSFVERELQTTMPEDGYLVVTDYEWSPPDYYYCPLRNGGDAIFAMLNDERTRELTDSVTGVFEPADLKLYQEFSDVLGKDLPGRIGIVTMETAEQYNQRRASNAEGMKYAGLALTGLGLAGVFIRATRKKKVVKQRLAA